VSYRDIPVLRDSGAARSTYALLPRCSISPRGCATRT
jgi:hypothetical protein